MIARPSAMTDSLTVSVLVISTSPRHTEKSTIARTTPFFTDRFPLVIGRVRVRLTCLSKLRSVRSLTTHPALRVIITPSVKITQMSSRNSAAAYPATVRAIHVGQRSTIHPMGRSSRVTWIQSGIYEASVWMLDMCEVFLVPDPPLN